MFKTHLWRKTKRTRPLKNAKTPHDQDHTDLNPPGLQIGLVKAAKMLMQGEMVTTGITGTTIGTENTVMTKRNPPLVMTGGTIPPANIVIKKPKIEITRVISHRAPKLKTKMANLYQSFILLNLLV